MKDVGLDRSTAGHLADRPLRFNTELWLTRVGISVTALATALFLIACTTAVLGYVQHSQLGRAAASLTFVGLALFLVYGNLVYQAARIGYLHRRRTHVPPSYEALDRFLDREAPPVTVLVPSYKEEPKVVRQTLLSALLQAYPELRVVLLIDDAPERVNNAPGASSSTVWSLPGEINGLFAAPAHAAWRSLSEAEQRCSAGWERDHEALRLAEHFTDAAVFFDTLANGEAVEDHVDVLFVEQVLRGAAREHSRKANKLLAAALACTPPSDEALLQGYRHLVDIFTVNVSAFQRKVYVNLSHEPNKAMNLNSYLSLMGREWREVVADNGIHLVEDSAGTADLIVLHTPYVAILDADTILLPDYLARLVYVMEQPGNERMAVAQTPYSAIPGAAATLERLAGATIDATYIYHQGSTRYRATYWVGANAVIRRRALDDICTVEYERNFPVQRYIQDNTVIEDTESTIDLAAQGWKLYNYPERLSFSATPPDFGSLIIQRRRWANGGLIILPKLLRYLWQHRRTGVLGEGIMRFHYLAAIAGSNVALFLLSFMPFESLSAVTLLAIAAAPYFFFYGRGLVQIGYRRLDIVRVYALNLLLLPVNLGGVVKSIQQGLTGRKIPFGRTPKVNKRTPAPPLYLIVQVLVIVAWSFAAVVDVLAGRWLPAAFGTCNVALVSYAIGRFIGWRLLVTDIVTGVQRRG